MEENDLKCFFAAQRHEKSIVVCSLLGTRVAILQ
ncbi:hypothetical protein PP1Y_AT36881 [Novosphingobium sp. PP1Y]|nr:hypothetical protein PP1Y_AT36881 [Novosphingobium sp. PP1Y]